MMAPAATPRDIVARINTELNKSLGVPEVRERMLALGTDPVGGSAEEFGAMLKVELAKWAKAVKISGAKVE